jgi:hypothetical protein
MKTKRVWNKKKINSWRKEHQKKLHDWKPIKGKLYRTNTDCDLLLISQSGVESRFTQIDSGSIVLFVERDHQPYTVWSKVVYNDCVGWVCLMPEQLEEYKP